MSEWREMGTAQSLNSTITMTDPFTFRIGPEKPVKRRIYLFQDPNVQKVRVLAFGFRADDAEKLGAFAANNYSVAALEVDPGEVEVKVLRLDQV